MARLGEVTFTLYRDEENRRKHGETDRDRPELCSADAVTVNCGDCSRYCFEAHSCTFTSMEQSLLEDLKLAFQYTDKDGCMKHKSIDKNNLVSFHPCGLLANPRRDPKLSIVGVNRDVTKASRRYNIDHLIHPSFHLRTFKIILASRVPISLATPNQLDNKAQ